MHNLEAIDIIKTPSVLVSFIKAEAEKGYHAPAIKDATIKEFKNANIGVKFLQIEKVLNKQHKVLGCLDAPFIGAVHLKSDLDKSLKWLGKNGCKTEEFFKSKYRGLAFATEDNLQAL